MGYETSAERFFPLGMGPTSFAYDRYRRAFSLDDRYWPHAIHRDQRGCGSRRGNQAARK